MLNNTYLENSHLRCFGGQIIRAKGASLHFIDNQKVISRLKIDPPCLFTVEEVAAVCNGERIDVGIGHFYKQRQKVGTELVERQLSDCADSRIEQRVDGAFLFASEETRAEKRRHLDRLFVAHYFKEDGNTFFGPLHAALATLFGSLDTTSCVLGHRVCLG